MKKIFIMLLILLLNVLYTYAKYTQTCKVKYKRQYDWSNYLTVDVTFMSGVELNNATKTYKYDSYSTYGIIFWDKDEASIIKVSSFTGCGSEVTKSCITNKTLNLEGEDQVGKNWQICTKDYCY